MAQERSSTEVLRRLTALGAVALAVIAQEAVGATPHPETQLEADTSGYEAPFGVRLLRNDLAVLDDEAPDGLFFVPLRVAELPRSVARIYSPAEPAWDASSVEAPAVTRVLSRVRGEDAPQTPSATPPATRDRNGASLMLRVDESVSLVRVAF